MRVVAGVRKLTNNLSGNQLFPSMMSQMLLSLASFVIGLAVARFASKAQYGVFVLAFSLLGVFANVQNAVTNTPMTVLLHDRNEGERSNFVSALATWQLYLFIPTIGICGLVAVLVPSIRSALAPFHAIVPIVIGSVVGWLAREFVRALKISDLRVYSTVIMDLVCAVVSVGALYLIAIITSRKGSGAGLTAGSGIIALGIGATAGACVGFALPGRRLVRVRHGTGDVFREVWPLARWAVVGVVAGILQTRGYLIVATTATGLAGTANIAAARMLLMPVGVYVASAVRIVMAKGSEVHTGGAYNSLIRFILSVVVMMIIAWGVYVALLSVFYGPIVTILGPKYEHIRQLVVLWGLFFFFESIRYPIKNALLVLKEFRVVTRNDLISGAITIGLCILLGHAGGAAGIVGALCAGEFLLALLSAYELLYVQRRRARCSLARSERGH